MSDRVNSSKSFILPNVNYILSWDSKITPRSKFQTSFLEMEQRYTASISLDTRIETEFHDPDEMKRLLSGSSLSITNIYRDTTSSINGKPVIFNVRITGTGENVGDYTIMLRHKTKEYDTMPETESVTVKSEFVSKNKDYGEMQKLVDCVKEYLILCWKSNRPSQNVDKKEAIAV